MGLFKSKEQRRIDRDIEIRKGISQVKRHIPCCSVDSDYQEFFLVLFYGCLYSGI